MDKTEKKAVEWAWKEIFTPIIVRSVAYLVLLDIEKLIVKNRRKIVSDVASNTKHQIMYFLKSDDGRKLIIEQIKQRRKNKLDLISEINSTYGLKLDDTESTIHLRHMEKAVERVFNLFENLATKGKFRKIYDLSKQG